MNILKFKYIHVVRMVLRKVTVMVLRRVVVLVLRKVAVLLRNVVVFVGLVLLRRLTVFMLRNVAVLLLRSLAALIAVSVMCCGCGCDGWGLGACLGLAGFSSRRAPIRGDGLASGGPECLIWGFAFPGIRLWALQEIPDGALMVKVSGAIGPGDLRALMIKVSGFPWGALMVKGA
jgi:hypothetical protein